MILYRLFRDERAVFEASTEVEEQYQVKGKPAHDARLVVDGSAHF